MLLNHSEPPLPNHPTFRRCRRSIHRTQMLHLKRPRIQRPRPLRNPHRLLRSPLMPRIHRHRHQPAWPHPLHRLLQGHHRCLRLRDALLIRTRQIPQVKHHRRQLLSHPFRQPHRHRFMPRLKQTEITCRHSCLQQSLPRALHRRRLHIKSIHMPARQNLTTQKQRVMPVPQRRIHHHIARSQSILQQQLRPPHRRRQTP